MEMEKTYNPAAIEEKIYDRWLQKKYFHAEVDRSKKPFTIVMPPPNITGQLHIHVFFLLLRALLLPNYSLFSVSFP